MSSNYSQMQLEMMVGYLEDAFHDEFEILDYEAAEDVYVHFTIKGHYFGDYAIEGTLTAIPYLGDEGYLFTIYPKGDFGNSVLNFRNAMAENYINMDCQKAIQPVADKYNLLFHDYTYADGPTD